MCLCKICTLCSILWPLSIDAWDLGVTGIPYSELKWFISFNTHTHTHTCKQYSGTYYTNIVYLYMSLVPLLQSSTQCLSHISTSSILI